MDVGQYAQSQSPTGVPNALRGRNGEAVDPLSNVAPSVNAGSNRCTAGWRAMNLRLEPGRDGRRLPQNSEKSWSFAINSEYRPELRRQPFVSMKTQSQFLTKAARCASLFPSQSGDDFDDRGFRHGVQIRCRLVDYQDLGIAVGRAIPSR